MDTQIYKGTKENSQLVEHFLFNAKNERKTTDRLLSCRGQRATSSPDVLIDPLLMISADVRCYYHSTADTRHYKHYQAYGEQTHYAEGFYGFAALS